MFDKKLTSQLAELSKIHFNENELEKMTEDMTHIIDLMDKVKEFSQSESKRSEATEYSELRTDEKTMSLDTEGVIKNAKAVSGKCFTVPKVV